MPAIFVIADGHCLCRTAAEQARSQSALVPLDNERPSAVIRDTDAHCPAEPLGEPVLVVTRLPDTAAYDESSPHTWEIVWHV